VNETTEEDLREIFRKGFEEGLSTAEIGDRIAGYYRDHCVGADKVRPQTAARTQTAGCVNDGLMAAARDVGGVRKFWIHGGSRDPRPEHEAAAARYDEEHAIPLDEDFEVGGERMSAPGDAAADISQTANCSCVVGFTTKQGASR
jgi:hypothetical protein